VLVVLTMTALGASFVELYTAILPDLCSHTNENKCLMPLFRNVDKMDVYAYVNGNRINRGIWHSIGNWTGIYIQDQVLEADLQGELLKYIRSFNTSVSLQVIFVRSGMNPELSAHRKYKNDHYENIVHVSGKLTKFQIPSQAVYSNLLQADTFVRNETTWKIVLLIVCFIACGAMTPSFWVASIRILQIGVLIILISSKKAPGERLRSLNSVPSTIHLRHGLINIDWVHDSRKYSLIHQPPTLFLRLHGRYAGRPVQYNTVKQKYVPPVFVNDFSETRRDWVKLDSFKNDSIRIGIKLNSISVGRYTITMFLQECVDMYHSMGLTEDDVDEIKYMLFSRPLHVLVAIQVIGFIQVILSSLAFKNDISFFKGRIDFAGLSARTIVTDAIQSWVIFLYVFDFEHSSRIVLFQLGAAALIGTWKVARRYHLKVHFVFFLPWLKWLVASSSGEKETEKIIDDLPRFVKWFIYPLAGVWGMYSLVNYEHKSWWSWFISSLADFAYAFGFVNMLPQIFVNYKLKSTAHMPWRVLIYKAFNTFIDDVFAFWIIPDKMSEKHKYMTLRDDLIFLIFLFQRYIYRVDATRPDEFGYVYSGDPDSKEDMALKEKSE